MEKEKMNQITRRALRHLVKEYRGKMHEAIEEYDYLKMTGFEANLDRVMHYNRLIYETKTVLKEVN